MTDEPTLGEIGRSLEALRTQVREGFLEVREEAQRSRHKLNNTQMVVEGMRVRQERHTDEIKENSEEIESLKRAQTQFYRALLFEAVTIIGAIVVAVVTRG